MLSSTVANPTAVSSPSPSGVELALVCRVRHCLCALPVADVVETMRPLPVQPLGAMPSFVTGVSVIRGAAVPVLDAGALFGSAAPSAPARFVVIRTGGRRLALAVEGVVGVREIRGAALQALPSILGEASHETVAAIGTLDAELLVVLRAARILPESTWDAFALASREVPP